MNESQELLKQYEAELTSAIAKDIDLSTQLDVNRAKIEQLNYRIKNIINYLNHDTD